MTEFDRFWNANQPMIADHVCSDLMIHVNRLMEIAFDAGVRSAAQTKDSPATAAQLPHGEICQCREGHAWASHLKEHPSIKDKWLYCPHCGKLSPC